MAKTYDPAKVIVTFGPTRITGFFDGSMVKVEYTEDAWMDKIGSAGEGARSKTNDESATITVVLMQTADMNDILSAYYEADRVRNGGQQTMQVRDASGRSLYLASTAWIKKQPTSDFARELGSREWVFRTLNLQSFIGGN